MSEDYQAPSGAEHPIPPPELVEQLRHEAPHNIRDTIITREVYLITAAYRAGADQELEACCEWVSQWCGRWPDGTCPEDELRAFRRPKPPSLAEEALALISHDPENQPYLSEKGIAILRRALERLQELEGNG